MYFGTAFYEKFSKDSIFESDKRKWLTNNYILKEIYDSDFVEVDHFRSEYLVPGGKFELISKEGDEVYFYGGFYTRE